MLYTIDMIWTILFLLLLTPEEGIGQAILWEFYSREIKPGVKVASKSFLLSTDEGVSGAVGDRIRMSVRQINQPSTGLFGIENQVAMPIPRNREIAAGAAGAEESETNSFSSQRVIPGTLQTGSHDRQQQR
jgi:hypothetical protein